MIRRGIITVYALWLGALMRIAEPQKAPLVEFTEPVEMRCTCYVSTGHCTADGTMPYEGILSSNREHLGDVAILYTLDGNYIGIFECRDIGGNQMLKNGTAVDVYRDSMERAYDWVHTYGDYVLVQWVRADG